MDYWGGKYIFVCKACDKLGGSGGMLPWEILSFITRNLVESGAFFYIIHHSLCHYKAFYKGLNRFTCNLSISRGEGGGKTKPRGDKCPHILKETLHIYLNKKKDCSVSHASAVLTIIVNNFWKTLHWVHKKKKELIQFHYFCC